MNWNFIAITKILIIITLFFGACTIEERERNVKIPMAVPQNTLLVITNNFTKDNTFLLKINKDFYLTAENVADIICQQTSDQDSLNYLEAWKWVQDRTQFNNPLSEEQWAYHFNVFINSLGEGRCAHRAAMLAQIWQELGYEARVWGLTGHVVPEVKINDQWRMLDPDKSVYFLNPQQEIASVEDISNSNIRYFCTLKDTFSIQTQEDWHFINGFLWNFYLSKQDNAITSYFTETTTRIDTYFTLPAHSRIECCPIETENTTFKTLKIIVPPHTTGTLYAPLVLNHIKGNAIIQFAHQKENQTIITPNENSYIPPAMPEKIVVQSVQDSTAFYFRINSAIHVFAEQNTITTVGTQVEGLTIQTRSLPDKQQGELPVLRAQPVKDSAYLAQFRRFMHLSKARNNKQLLSLEDFVECFRLYLTVLPIDDSERGTKLSQFQTFINTLQSFPPDTQAQLLQHIKDQSQLFHWFSEYFHPAHSEQTFRAFLKQVELRK